MIRGGIDIVSAGFINECATVTIRLQSTFRFFGILLLTCGLCAPVPADDGPRSIIKVVMDNNYPPYVFTDNDGNLQGILIDQWRLWEQKTGLRVEIHAMDWGLALGGMKAGKFDVIDTIFKTDERGEWLDFTHPYARLEVPIFFLHAISGITDVASLKGFPVAAKTGDAAVDMLKRSGIDNLQLFDSYEAVILAAKAHKVTVFVTDAPPSLYFLHKFGLQDLYKQSAPLYVGQFHRAVKKGNRELLEVVEAGFAEMSDRELSRIETKWFGLTLGNGRVLGYVSGIAGGLALVMLALFAWNRVLRRQVAARTAELNTSIEALQTLSKRQEAILTSVPDIIMEVDANKVYTWSNSAGQAFFGPDVIGKPITAYFVGDQNTGEVIQPLFDGVAKVLYVESWQRRKDGEGRLLAWWCKELRNEQGQVSGALSTARDITDHRRMEAELHKVQQLRSIGTMAGGIAHDFNNILMGLFGNIALAKKEIPAGHAGYLPLAEAEKSMARAVRLSNQLLTFAKGGGPRKEEISLAELVEDVARFDLSGSNVMLVYQQAADLWLTKADKGQIQQVISNLAINARQAMADGGHLYINLENAELTHHAIPELAPGKYVRVTVRDEGPGMSREIMARIFEPYFTTKQMGHGLGLAMTYSVIRQHDGHIGVESEPGKGATFTIHLPALAPQSGVPGLPAADSPAVLRGPAKILILDDEDSIRAVLSRWLKKMACSVETTADGHHAVELYRQAMEGGVPFDAVILDLTIPGGIGGSHVIKAMLALDSNVRGIASSGYSDDPAMSNYALYGFKGVIPKPYTETQLSAVLATVLNERYQG